MTIMRPAVTEPDNTEAVRSLQDEAPAARPDAAATVLSAAQALRRSTKCAPASCASTFGSLEATLDSLGVSITELRGPLLRELENRWAGHPASRAAELDAARLAAKAAHDLGEAAAACGELRALLGEPGSQTLRAPR